MGSLILCHKKRAKQPYEITRVHIRVYTIEELCYYVCNNLYLIDHTIMNLQLCQWIGTELSLPRLAQALQEELEGDCTQKDFVLTLLRESVIYDTAEINKIQGILERLGNQREVEKQKYKADSLMERVEYSAAVLTYQSILGGKQDEAVDKTFYARVYANLGAAYGRLFLYEEAAGAYREACSLCEDRDMMKAFLYSYSRAYPQEDYMKLLSGNPVYLSLDRKLKEELAKIHEDTDPDISLEQLEIWKKEYRRIDKNQGI